MVVISVPASGDDDNPMLTLYGALSCFVAHLIYSLLINVWTFRGPRFSGNAAVPPSYKNYSWSSLECGILYFWILYLYRFNLHVHWQKAITKGKKKLPRRATRVMTCWLTASLQQWRLQATCVMSRGLGNSPRWASLNWAHCSLTSKFIFPCVQNRMWKKITIKKKMWMFKSFGAVSFIVCFTQWYSQFGVSCVNSLQGYSWLPTTTMQKTPTLKRSAKNFRTFHTILTYILAVGVICCVRLDVDIPYCKGSPTWAWELPHGVQSHAKGNRFATLLWWKIREISVSKEEVRAFRLRAQKSQPKPTTSSPRQDSVEADQSVLCGATSKAAEGVVGYSRRS